MTFDQAFWDNRYKSGQTGWDIGYPSTPLVEYIDQLTDKNLKILIPGAGNGHEALYLHNKGFQHVTVIDISSLAIESVKSKLPSDHNIHLIRDDFFNHNDQYDLIIEQTFFCALKPSMRPLYVEHCFNLLKKRGSIVGVMFDVIYEKEGPPFGGSEEEYKQLFKSHFNVIYCDPCKNSIHARQGSELFVKFQKATDQELLLKKFLDKYIPKAD